MLRNIAKIAQISECDACMAIQSEVVRERAMRIAKVEIARGLKRTMCCVRGR